jgi:hypothetical protein
MLLFPPTSWWRSALDISEQVGLSVSPSLSKGQVYNRYSIITANGLQNLSVPLKRGRKQRVPLDELHIDYKHDWQRQHWGALYSAYGRAPFFEHYGPELEGLLYQGHERLVDLNIASIAWATNAMRLPITFEEMRVVEKSEWEAESNSGCVYHQVFEERWGFTPGLSIVDLLMNEGPYSSRFLSKAEV